MSTLPPRLTSPDSTLSLLREGYRFFPKHTERFHSDVFRGRLFGEAAYFMTGPDAAELFYDSSRFGRADAVPSLIKKTLFGQGGAQSLDGERHRIRKELFLSLMNATSLERFLDVAEASWSDAIEQWARREDVELAAESRLLLCRAACEWAGIPLPDRDARELASDCARMVSDFAGVGFRTPRARRARSRAESWARRVIRAVRHGLLEPPSGSAARVIATYREDDERPLDERVAAVELLNVIRPITAIGVWCEFIALALRDYPEYLEALRTGEEFIEPFVQEVRRFYPFAPVLAARVNRPFEWRGTPFPKGLLVVLDVYGTLHDRRVWNSPESFRPERFVGRAAPPFAFIPQGGDVAGGHRCAGDWFTVEVMKQALRVLARDIDYVIPAQDLGYRLSTVPTGPRSGVVIAGVRHRMKKHLEGAPASTRRAKAGPTHGGPDATVVAIAEIHSRR